MRFKSKNVLELFLFILFLIGNSNTHAQMSTGFNIQGRIEGLPENTKIFLIQYSTRDTVDVSIIKEKKFSFSGVVPNATEYYYTIVDRSINLASSNGFLLENTKMNLNIDYAKWPVVELKGSKTQDECDEITSIWMSFEDRLKASTNSQEWNSIEAERKSEIKKFIYSNNNSLYVPDIIYRENFANEEKKEMYDRLGITARQSFFGKRLKKRLDQIQLLKRIKEGTIIPNITFQDYNGKQVSLHEVISNGKVTLIDFWASWCKPCRASFMDLRQAYDQFHKKGFNIVSIAVNDEEKDWKKAIEKDSVGAWFHGVDNKNIAYTTFDIPGIPAYILVSPDRKMLAYNCPNSSIAAFGPEIKGKALQKTLKTILDSLPVKEGSSSLQIPIPAVKIGDKVPDISIGKIYNHPTLKTAKISDFKGKLLILDFWSTYCKICIAQFPKIERLRAKYGDKVEILPVGFDVYDTGAIKKFVDKRKKEKGVFNLPTAIREPYDTLLERMFPFSSMPVEVWIGKDGKLLGVTDHTCLNEKTIENVINKENVNLPAKKLIDISIGYKFLLNKLDNGNPVFGSAFSGFIDTLGWISSDFIRRGTDSNYFYRAANLTLQDYYCQAYSPQFPELPSFYLNRRIVIDGVNSNNYQDWSIGWSGSSQYTNQTDFRKANTFSYELRLPAKLKLSEAYSRFIADLDNAFSMKSKTETRQVKCYALVKKDKSNKLPVEETGVGFPEISTNEDFSNIIYRKIIPKEMMDNFNSDTYFPCPYPVIDETNIQYPISITLPIDGNIDTKRKALNKYGLDLIEVTRPLNVIILESLNQ